MDLKAENPGLSWVAMPSISGHRVPAGAWAQEVAEGGVGIWNFAYCRGLVSECVYVLAFPSLLLGTKPGRCMEAK